MHALRTAFVLIFAFAACTPARAALITVDSTEPGLDSGACTLLDAMTAVRYHEPVGTCPAGSGVDQIELPAAATITLSDWAADSFNAAFPIVSSYVVIRGNGATLATSFDGCDPHVGPHMRFFSVLTGGHLELRNLTLTNGCDDSVDGGGAVFAYQSTLVLDHVTLTHNTSSTWGGAVYAPAATVTIDASTVSDNRTDNTLGSAAVHAGNIRISNSTFARNIGGALAAVDADVVNSTFHDNTTGSAIDVAEHGAISFSTFVGNVPRALSLRGGSSNVLANNLIVQSPGGGSYPLCDLDPLFSGEDADVTLTGANFADDTSCGDVTPIARPALALAAPGDYGGPVATIPVHAGSVAIDAGSCTDASGNPVTTDARGTPRPSGAGCEAGAFEYAGVDLGPPASVRVAAGGVFVSNLGFVTEYDRSGNELQRVYSPALPYQYICGVDAIGVAGFAAQQGGTPPAALQLGLFAANRDTWTYATAAGRATGYCGTIAHAGSRWFLTVGGLSMMQDFYGVTVFEAGIESAPIATDLAVFDAVRGKDGRVYLLGEPLTGDPRYVVRAYDPESLQPLGEFQPAGDPRFVDTVSIAVAANGDVYVGRRGAEIDRYDRNGAPLQSTDCVVPGNASQCQVVTNLRLSDDGLLFVGDNAGRVTILQPDFSSGWSFPAGYPGVPSYVAPLPPDAIFAGTFDPQRGS